MVPPDPDDRVAVRWYLARDEDFTERVVSGTVAAEPELDHVVRLRLTDLTPYTEYYYRFVATLPDGEVVSETGRTLTAPTPDMDVPVRFAIASCQEYVGRWYHAWRSLVNEPDPVDFVLFLGDYIYEWIGDPTFQPLDSPRSLSLPDGMSLDGSDTNLTAVSLADYRALYQQYRSDPDLRRVHARFPFVIIWDDHEFCNDCWQDVANDFNGEQGIERDTVRRMAATQAWVEYLPVDVPYDPDASYPLDIETWRAFRWGRHAELALTDARYYRDDHVVPEDMAVPSVGKLTPNNSLGSRVLAIKEGFDELEAEVAPTMLGAQQRDWLTATLSSSDATWKLLASPLMMAQMVIDLREIPQAPPLLRNAFYFKLDQWDGFRTERAAIFEALADVEGLVVLSGDLHGNYVSELRVDFDDPSTPAIGTELTVTGISSLSLQEQLVVAAQTEPLLMTAGLEEVLPLFDANLLESGPHYAYANSSAYGYAVIDLDDERLQIRFVELERVTEPEHPGVRRDHTWVLPRGQTRPTRV